MPQVGERQHYHFVLIELSHFNLHADVKRTELFATSVRRYRKYPPVPTVVSLILPAHSQPGVHGVLSLDAGKGKCMAKSGDCVVKHPGSFATGMGLVVSAATVQCC